MRIHGSLRSAGWTLVGAVCLLAAIGSGCGGSGGDSPAAANIAGAAGSNGTSKRLPADNPNPVVVLSTSAGEITIKLDAKHAPISVNNFLNYVNSGHYEQTIFHQVHAGFAIVGGGYDAALKERPTDMPIRNEAHNGLKNRRGTIAMAREGDSIDSSTCQFFFNLADNASLDHVADTPDEYGYCVFGEVTEGLDVLDKIGQAEVRNSGGFENLPVDAIEIKSVRRIK